METSIESRHHLAVGLLALAVICRRGDGAISRNGASKTEPTFKPHA